jgi:hypothetical protein
MDITTLAAWGEFVGGIAVVVSLVYLASQIRQNSKLLEAAADDARIQGSNTAGALLVGDPEVTRIYWDGSEDREALSESDRRRFDAFMSMQYQSFVQQWEHHRRGQSTVTGWDQMLLGMRWQCGRPGIIQWWREYRGLYSPEFRDFLDGLIHEGRAAG